MPFMHPGLWSLLKSWEAPVKRRKIKFGLDLFLCAWKGEVSTWQRAKVAHLGWFCHHSRLLITAYLLWHSEWHFLRQLLEAVTRWWGKLGFLALTGKMSMPLWRVKDNVIKSSQEKANHGAWSFNTPVEFRAMQSWPWWWANSWAESPDKDIDVSHLLHCTPSLLSLLFFSIPVAVILFLEFNT